MADYVTISNVAEELGISPSSIRRLEKQGQIIPKRTLGGHRRYTPDDVVQMREYLGSRLRFYGKERELPHVKFD